MKKIFALLLLAYATITHGAALHLTPVSNHINVPNFLGVATDGLNVVQVAASDYALQSVLDATNAHFQTAIAGALAYSLGKTNPAAVIDSAFAGYVGLKLLQRSNDWLNLGFFDYTGAEAFRFRAGLTNGLFDLFDVQNDRTIFRYEGTNKAITFFTEVRLNYLGTPSTVLIAGANREATNSPVTAAELGHVAGVTAPIQTQINALRSGELRPSSFILATNYTLATNVSILFVDATLSNIVVTIPTNTALLDGQQWTLRVVKGTNLLDLRRLSPGFDLIAFHTNLTLAFGEGVTITKLGTNFLAATSASGGPIGTITAWHPNLAGVPKLSSLWARCDFGTISDPGSPLNGSSKPDLNNSLGVNKKRFLLGSTTSGATYDLDTHNHTFSATSGEASNLPIGITSGADYFLPDEHHTHDVAGTTSTEAHYPPYFEVVWIIRIK